MARTRASDVIELMRPRQWTKNLAVFAAVLFSGSLGDVGMLVTVAAAFAALCLVSSGLYALNDSIDAERDKLHPIKKNRPVASGRVSRQGALAIGTALIITGTALSAALGAPFLACVAGYLTIQALYSVWLKNISVVDMLVIATGFVIRAVSGALVIDVAVSPWLVLCTGLLALFLASAKRRHELVLLREGSSGHRPVLDTYSAELLDSFMVTLSAATVTSYSLYTFFEQGAPGYTMMLTIPFVIYGILRYQSLVLRDARGGRPEEVLLGDRPIMLDIALWAASAVVILYVLPRFI